jgi:hypothetical protein
MIKPPDQILGVAAVYSDISFAGTVCSWSYWSYRFEDDHEDNHYASIVISEKEGGSYHLEALWSDYWRDDAVSESEEMFSVDIPVGEPLDGSIEVGLKQIRERIVDEITRSLRFVRYLNALTPGKQPEAEPPSFWERLEGS